MTVGRPTTYTVELADRICEEIALGSSMRTVCRADDMPAMSSVFKWLREHPEFSEQYEQATKERTEALSEELLDIADDGTNDWMMINRKDGSEAWQLNGEHVQRSRLRIDTRKWLMAKMKPKKYGEHIDVTSDGEKIETTVIYRPEKIKYSEDDFERGDVVLTEEQQ